MSIVPAELFIYCRFFCFLFAHLLIRTGFMYLRYTQPPGDLYDWYEDYLQDEEEIDVKAGGGQVSQLYEPPINIPIYLTTYNNQSRFALGYIHSMLSFLGLAGSDHGTNGLSVYDQTGLVLHTLSTHTCAHTEADREKDRTILPGTGNNSESIGQRSWWCCWCRWCDWHHNCLGHRLR